VDVGHPKGGQLPILVAEMLQVLTPQLVHLQKGLAVQDAIVLRHTEGFSHFSASDWIARKCVSLFG